MVAGVEGAVEKQDGEPVAEVALEHPAQRAGTEVGVVSAGGQPRLGGGADVEGDAEAAARAASWRSWIRTMRVEVVRRQATGTG